MGDGPGGSLGAAPPASWVLTGWQWGQEAVPLPLGTVLGVSTWYSWPVYWPRKVTRSGRLALPTPLIPSPAVGGLSVVVLLFSENSRREAGSDSELRDSRGTSRGTEEDLARRLPAGTAGSAPPGSPDSLSVDLLPQWGPQGAEASAGRARARAGRLKADAGRVGLPGAGGCRLSSSRRRSRATSSCSSRMAWSRPVLVSSRVEVVSVSPRGRTAGAGAGVLGGLTVVLRGRCSETRFRPSSSEPGSAISAASARSRRKLGALCRRGLSRPEGRLWARLLGVLGSATLLGTGGPLVWGWEAAFRGADAVKGWVSGPGALMWDSRCSGVWARGDTLLVSEPTKPLSVSGDAIQGSSTWGLPAW